MNPDPFFQEIPEDAGLDVLGHLISAQLRDHLETRVTGGEPFFASEAAGRYLLEAVF